MNYQFELKNTTLLKNVFALIDIKKPSIVIEKTKSTFKYFLITIFLDSKTYFAGVLQNLHLILNPGTIPLNEKSNLKISYAGTKQIMEFLVKSIFFNLNL